MLKRIAYNAVNPTLRGAVVAIVGYRGATWWDSPRIEVRIVLADGSLSAETWLVLPSIVINL